MHAATGMRYIVERYYNENDIKKKTFVEMVAYVIGAHHGLFDFVSEDGTDRFLYKMEKDENYKEAVSNAEKNILNHYKLDELFKSAFQEFSVIFDKIILLFEKIKSLESFEFYLSCLLRVMLSILIDSDWTATSQFMENDSELYISDEKAMKNIIFQACKNYDGFMKKLEKTSLKKDLSDLEKDILKARKEMQEECKSFAKNPTGIYCLPLPTGAGKTLSSLGYALEFCKKNYQSMERIFYISPYISITEQNAEVFQKAIGNADWVLEHHSAVIRIDNNSEDCEMDKGSMFDLNWEEPFICTTFVQFMNTLFSDRKECVRRMHRLINSVIIVDEVQSIPMRCIDTFNLMMNFLAEICNTDIIFCTATQPQLGNVEYPVFYSEPKNLIKNVDSRFHEFDRVKINYERKNLMSFDELGERVIEKIERYDSVLVVLNTKSAVKKLYDILKNTGIRVEYLTTNLCPENRSDKIKDIKVILDKNRKNEEKSKEKIVVISTSLIEAGVDISFECVCRSLAGLDSIAQSAGRCNRNGERKFGELYIFKIDENIGKMEELVEARNATNEELDLCDQIDNILYPERMDRFYKRYYKTGSKNQNAFQKDRMKYPIHNMYPHTILGLLSNGFYAEKKHRDFMNQALKTAGQNYKIIDQDMIGVIVPYKKGKNIIEQLRITEEPKEIRKLIREAQRYTVNIPFVQVKKMDGLIQPVSDYIAGIYIPNVDSIYNNEYGLTENIESFIL